VIVLISVCHMTCNVSILSQTVQFLIVVFFVIYGKFSKFGLLISEGSAATYLRCGGRY